MEHSTNDVYTIGALPVPEKGSSVMPIPTENPDIGDCPPMPAKLWHAAEPKAHPVFAEGGVELSPVAVVQSTSPPQTQSESPEEEKSKVASITDEEVGEESCYKMAAGPKWPPLAAREGRMSNQLRKRAPGKYPKFAVYLLCWVAFIPLLVSEADPVSDPPPPDQKLFCFTCNDKDRCPKLINVYESDGADTPLYHRGPNETFPECSVTTDVHNCSVCLNNSGIIIIISSKNKIDVEDGNGSIPFIDIDCVQQPTTPSALQPSKPPSTPANQTPTTPNQTITHPSHPDSRVVVWVVLGMYSS
ncbi:uncharacterized protein LOC130187950 isoform X2 [Pseudoliparis swirei]|nr:uncharacterized protein LOC130187950 isoform X2 [Pseudoliparis swirei]